jgi:hypothetical protein
VPALAPGRRIVVDLLAADEIDLSVQARFVDVGSATAAPEDPPPGDLIAGDEGEEALAEPTLR